MPPSDSTAAIRIAVLGEWMASQLADALALQRAEEPEMPVVLTEHITKVPMHAPPGGCDFALSSVPRCWQGWQCEPLWHDTLMVAMTQRSHLLAHRAVPCAEVLKQPLIRAQSTVAEPWRTETERMFDHQLEGRELTVNTFGMVMTLVAAGYGIAIAPSSMLTGHQTQGIAMRPLAGAPIVAMVYLLYHRAPLTEPQARFIQRMRSMA